MADTTMLPIMDGTGFNGSGLGAGFIGGLVVGGLLNGGFGGWGGWGNRGQVGADVSHASYERGTGHSFLQRAHFPV